MNAKGGSRGVLRKPDKPEAIDFAAFAEAAGGSGSRCNVAGRRQDHVMQTCSGGRV